MYIVQFAQSFFRQYFPAENTFFTFLKIFLFHTFGQSSPAEKEKLDIYVSFSGAEKFCVFHKKILATNGAESPKKDSASISGVCILQNSNFLLCFFRNFKHFSCYGYFFQFPFITVCPYSQEKWVCKINIYCVIGCCDMKSFCFRIVFLEYV